MFVLIGCENMLGAENLYFYNQRALYISYIAKYLDKSADFLCINYVPELLCHLISKGKQLSVF